MLHFARVSCRFVLRFCVGLIHVFRVWIRYGYMLVVCNCLVGKSNDKVEIMYVEHAQMLLC